MRLPRLASPIRPATTVTAISIALAVGALAAACGGGNDQSPDAADGPPPIDAPVRGPVTITVTANGNPVAGVDVVWTEPDGTIVAHEATNSLGQASEELIAGSAATLAVVGGGNSRVTATWLDVEPGDDLHWSFGRASAAPVGNLSVTLPGPRAGAATYQILTGCATYDTTNATTPLTGPLSGDCLGSDQTIDVVAVAYDSNGMPLCYDHATGVAVSSGGTTTVTLDAWQTAYDLITFNLTNAPADVSGVGVEPHFRIDGLDFPGPGGGGQPGGSTITALTGYWQGGIVDSLQYVMFLARGPVTAPDGLAVLLGGKAGAPTTVDHDLSTLLPTVTGASAADDGGRLQLAWTAAGSFDSADGALIVTSWRDNGITHQAYVMAPPQARSPITVPPLPEALAAYRTTVDSVFLDPTVVFAEADFLDGYAGFRPDGWGIFGSTATDFLPAGDALVRATLGGSLPGGNMARTRGARDGVLPAPPYAGWTYTKSDGGSNR